MILLTNLDIVFLRAWYPVKPRRYYNPVSSLLLDDKENWKGMRVTGQIRFDQGLNVPEKPESKYTKIDKPIFAFPPLIVPKKLQASLPYEAKVRLPKWRDPKSYLETRPVIVDPAEQEVRELLNQVMTIRNEKIRTQKLKMQKAADRAAEEHAAEAVAKKQFEKQRTKEYWITEVKKRKNEGGMSGNPQKRSR